MGHRINREKTSTKFVSKIATNLLHAAKKLKHSERSIEAEPAGSYSVVSLGWYRDTCGYKCHRFSPAPIQELHSQFWQQTAARLTVTVETQEPSSLGDSLNTAKSFYLLSLSSSRSASRHLLPIIHLIKTMPKGFLWAKKVKFLSEGGSAMCLLCGSVY